MHELKSSALKLTNLIEVLNDKQGATDTLCTKNKSKIELHGVQIERFKQEFEALSIKSLAKWKQFEELEFKFQGREEFTNFIEETKDFHKTVTIENEKLLNRIMTLENYTEKYIPIKTINYIVEAFNDVMPSKSLRKVKEYEEKVNKIIHTTVLNDQGISNIQKTATYRNQMTDSELIPDVKTKKKISKASLINQYSSIIGRRNDDEKSINLEVNSVVDVEKDEDIHSKQSIRGNSRAKMEDNSVVKEADIHGTAKDSDSDYQMSFNNVKNTQSPLVNKGKDGGERLESIISDNDTGSEIEVI